MPLIVEGLLGTRDSPENMSEDMQEERPKSCFITCQKTCQIEM